MPSECAPDGQRDQPEPVARPAHVVGRAPAVGRRAARQPVGIVGPVAAGRDGPRRATTPRWRRGRWLGEAELALEQARRGPLASTSQRAVSVRVSPSRFVAHRVRRTVGAEVDAAHHRAVDAASTPARARARRGSSRSGRGRSATTACGSSWLTPSSVQRSMSLAAVAEEEAEAELADVLGVEVLAQAQHVGEVMRADLDRGFAHLERAFAHRMAVALDHGHAQRRIAAAAAAAPGVSPARPPPRMATSVSVSIAVSGACSGSSGARFGEPRGGANSPLGSSITGGRGA